MKKYEWSNKQTSMRKCMQCGKTLEFADMKCSHCGADARREKREYRAKLDTSNIQTSARERVGAPHQPQDNYYLNDIANIEKFLIVIAVIVSAILGYVVGNACEKGKILIGLLIGIFAVIVLITIVCLFIIQMKNTAAAARNNERAALGVEYQIKQINEFITAFNKSKEVEDNNNEVFAKLLLRISKLEEAQKNSIEELTNIFGALSEKANASEKVPEEQAEEPAEEAAEDIPEETIEEPEENVSEEETEPENTESEEILEIEEIIKEAKEIEKEKKQEDAPAFDARSAGTEDWDDGFFDKDESKTEEDNKETEKNPTSRLDAFLDDDDE